MAPVLANIDTFSSSVLETPHIRSVICKNVSGRDHATVMATADMPVRLKWFFHCRCVRVSLNDMQTQDKCLDLANGALYAYLGRLQIVLLQ